MPHRQTPTLIESGKTQPLSLFLLSRSLHTRKRARARTHTHTHKKLLMFGTTEGEAETGTETDRNRQRHTSDSENTPGRNRWRPATQTPPHFPVHFAASPVLVGGGAWRQEFRVCMCGWVGVLVWTAYLCVVKVVYVYESAKVPKCVCSWASHSVLCANVFMRVCGHACIVLSSGGGNYICRSLDVV